MDYSVKLWDAVTGQESLTLKKDDRIWVESVAFSPDGRRLAAAGGDRTIKVWDTTTGEEVLRLKGVTYQFNQ